MKIAVIGGGIIGMTAAAVLQESGHNVHVFSRHPLDEITSSVAAAMIYPYGVEETARTQKWLQETDKYLEKLKETEGSGVGVTNWKKCAYNEDTLIPDFFYTLRKARALEDFELPKGFVKGIGAEIFMTNSQIHLPYVLHRFKAAGGKFQIREIQSIDQIAAEKYDCIINSTGVYAAEFAGDSSVQPGRGQVVLVRNPGMEYHFSTFEGRHYIYPRGEECILGGSMDIGEWNLTPDNELTEKILAWAADFDDRFKDIEVLAVRVGLRPMRPTVRLEMERHASGIPVIHNYGHGGAGYTLAWGCAFDVRDRVETIA